jgi:hypothetical protein
MNNFFTISPLIISLPLLTVGPNNCLKRTFQKLNFFLINTFLYIYFFNLNLKYGLFSLKYFLSTHFKGKRTQGECVIRTSGPDIDALFLDSMLYEEAKFIFRTKYQFNRK